MLDSYIKLEGLKGVGTVELTLDETQRVFTFIGENGIGKTKTLEALFQILFFGNSLVRANVASNHLVYGKAILGQKSLASPPASFGQPLPDATLQHNLPIVFVASQSRGFIQHINQPSKAIGSLEQRRNHYLRNIAGQMQNNFTSLSSALGTEEWFVTLAKSSNPYQDQADNREVEITAVMELLHTIDPRIDLAPISISGDERVSISIEGQKRELSQLSTGFASILKIIQTIISGYGYFTNETRLQDVKGVVLIDEIESHLHASWQTNIIPLLKRLFPNTTFYITTHSPIVLTQLQQGEAYQLLREQGVVKTRLIQSPNKVALVDALQDAFGINVNQRKLENLLAEDQQAAKAKLLSLLAEAEVKP